MSATSPTSNTTKPSFLMVGDSLVAGFSWQKRLPSFGVTNLGIPGLTTAELLSSLPQFQLRCPATELILVMIGTNDLLMGRPDFLDDLKKIVIWLSKAYPAAEILVNGLMPIQCPHDREQLVGINQTIAGICRETACCYVDVYSRFTQSDLELFEMDGVHLTTSGYELWARTLSEYIAFIMEND